MTFIRMRAYKSNFVNLNNHSESSMRVTPKRFNMISKKRVRADKKRAYSEICRNAGDNLIIKLHLNVRQFR